MSRSSALINTIYPFSCVDGPGNRLALFFQGCNMRCKSCHNPYTIGVCNHCTACVAACPNQALSVAEGHVIWHEETCNKCDTCLHICTRQSSPQARGYDTEQILALTRRYAPFINGLTVSGGEATLQLAFLTTLFQAIKQAEDLRHLTCLVDSNGTLAESGWQRLLPWMDGAMIDLKAWEDEQHRYLTGHSNTRVKHTIRWLAQHDKLAELRLLLIPNQTDYLQHIDQLADFIHQLGANINVRLNTFHHHGTQGAAAGWANATQHQTEELAAALAQRGITRLSLPALYLP